MISQTLLLTKRRTSNDYLLHSLSNRSIQRDAFKTYAEEWGRIIPRCGGNLIGYFLPYEGTNDIGWGLIAFDSLAAYDAYRMRLRADPSACANFALAQKLHLILREERTFLEGVDGTVGLPTKASGKA